MGEISRNLNYEYHRGVDEGGIVVGGSSRGRRRNILSQGSARHLRTNWNRVDSQARRKWELVIFITPLHHCADEEEVDRFKRLMLGNHHL